MAGALDQEKLAVAMASIRAWQADPASALVSCPVCAAKGLVITDCSSRPHAEWYRLQCASCGLEEMLNIPMGASGPSSAD